MKENGGPWPCHGRTYPGLRGTGGLTDAVGRRGMGSKTCMSHGRTQVAHRRVQSTQGSAQANAGSAQATQG